MMRTLLVSAYILLTVTVEMSYPKEWTSRDIGRVTARGSATYDGPAMTWTVQGEGSDIFEIADSFHFLYQPFVGDGSIIARVERVSQSHPWAKGGVMIRESLDPGSRCAFIYATPVNGVSTQIRAQTHGPTMCDNSVRTIKQQAVRGPVWVKLERKGDQFRGYYAADGPETIWIPVAWKPETVTMSQIVYVGLAVTSHKVGTICEAQFSGLALHSPIEGNITEVEILDNPKQARRKAYRNLEQLGDWRRDAEKTNEQGDLVANSLFAIARTSELNGESTSKVLPDYYRIVEMFPNSPSAVDALVRIATLDGNKGLNYAAKHLRTSLKRDQDRFYLGAMKSCADMSDTPPRDTVVRSFVEYVDGTSSFSLLEKAIAVLEDSEHGLSICKSLIQCGMAQPLNGRTAVTALRYVALRPGEGQPRDRVQDLAVWAAGQFGDTPLAACAMAVIADMKYDQGHYVEALRAFDPELLRGGESESEMVADMETALTSYRRSTLHHTMLDLENFYNALGREASSLGLHTVTLHCQRKIAETRGASIADFQQSAATGVKYSESSPENETWFWKGLVAAQEGDLGAACVSYEQFLPGSGRTVLAARACYDVARTKMAMGEDAQEWILKAKALCPCEAVLKLELQLNDGTAAQRQ